jgi:hypothetical protein
MNLTEEQEIKAGYAIARILRMKHDPEFIKSRWQTSWGSKTDLGVWRTVAGMVDDVREGKELEP